MSRTGIFIIKACLVQYGMIWLIRFRAKQELENPNSAQSNLKGLR